MEQTIDHQIHDFEKVLDPFIKNKAFLGHFDGMYCDCPVCHAPYALKVNFRLNIAECKKCNIKGTKDEFIHNLYLAKIKLPVAENSNLCPN